MSQEGVVVIFISSGVLIVDKKCDRTIDESWQKIDKNNVSEFLSPESE